MKSPGFRSDSPPADILTLLLAMEGGFGRKVENARLASENLCIFKKNVADASSVC